MDAISASGRVFSFPRGCATVCCPAHTTALAAAPALPAPRPSARTTKPPVTSASLRRSLGQSHDNSLQWSAILLDYQQSQD